MHEQVKRIHSIQNDIDAFQAGCDELIATQAASENEPAEEAEDFRADRFLQSALSLQTEFIGRALLEVGVWRECDGRSMTRPRGSTGV